MQGGIWKTLSFHVEGQIPTQKRGVGPAKERRRHDHEVVAPVWQQEYTKPAAKCTKASGSDTYTYLNPMLLHC